MTRKRLGLYLIVVFSLWVVGVVVAGVLLHYDTLGRLSTMLGEAAKLAAGMSLAWLAYCFQRRHNYVQSLRSTWSKIVPAVQDAIQYTHSPSGPGRQEYAKVLRDLSVAIEELRALFINIKADKNLPGTGIYPFEELKTIYKRVADLGFGETFKADQAKSERMAIVEDWKAIRHALVAEFDRDTPTSFSTPFLEEEPGNVRSDRGRSSNSPDKS